MIRTILIRTAFSSVDIYEKGFVYVKGILTTCGGEIVKTLIIKNSGDETDENEITRHCRRYLSSYKVLRVMAFVATLD